jgi:hypothetical protein
MLDHLTHEDLLKLTSVQEGPCVSIYIPALAEPALQEEYDALVKRASYLLSLDENHESHTKVMEGLFNFNPGEYISGPTQGVAIFVNKHWHGYYLAPHDLPEKVVVADSFHLKPLIEDLQRDHTYHLLVVGVDEALLLSAQGGLSSEIHTFLLHHGSHSNSIHWKHLDENEAIQIPHLKTQARGRGASDSQFKKKNATKLFLRWIESKINKEDGYKSLPLFVFTSELLFPLYKEITSHPQARFCPLDIRKGIPHHDSLIHRVENILNQESSHHRHLSTVDLDLQKAKNRIIDDLVKISRAALHGEVKTLYLRDNSEIWGQINRKTGEIAVHPKQSNAKDDDVLDDIACEVIRQGGEVIVLTAKDMPSPSPAAAILN